MQIAIAGSIIAQEKEMINNYVTKRYKFLIGVANNIVSSKKRRSSNIKEDANDLLSYTIEHICSRRDKYEKMPEHQLESNILSFMKNSWNWYNATAKSSFLRQTRMVNSGNGEVYEYDSADESSTVQMEMQAEDVCENVQDYILDLLNAGYSNEQISKILYVKDFYKKLDVYEQSLYDLYFTQGHSMKYISDIAQISHTSIKRMMMVIKIKLKNNYENDKIKGKI